MTAPTRLDRCTCGADGLPAGAHEDFCGLPEVDGPPDCHHPHQVPASTLGGIECRFCGVTALIRPPVTTGVAA